MTQLIFRIAFSSAAEKCKFTQTLNVGINLPTTEDAYKGMTKYFITVVPRLCIQTVNRALESKYNT